MKTKKTNIWKIREEILFSYYTKEEIQGFIDKLYSFSMLYQMINRDNYKCFNELNVSQQTFSKLLKDKIGFKLHVDNQKTSTAFRSQFKFPKNTSIEEIESYYLKTSLKGQKGTVKTRKKSGKPYNQKQTLEYWIEKTENIEVAKESLSSYKRSNSPFCIEFWLKKGLSRDNASAIISERAVKGAIGALKKTSKPKTEKRIESLLRENNIDYSIQYRINLTKDEALYNKRCYIYDFYLPKFNLIIECHGLFWHAHPSLYNENSVLDFPKGKIKASDIWSADSYKMKIAKKRNYNYLVIWENEIDNTINLINESVNNN